MACSTSCCRRTARAAVHRGCLSCVPPVARCWCVGRSPFACVVASPAPAAFAAAATTRCCAGSGGRERHMATPARAVPWCGGSSSMATSRRVRFWFERWRVVRMPWCARASGGGRCWSRCRCTGRACVPAGLIKRSCSPRALAAHLASRRLPVYERVRSTLPQGDPRVASRRQNVELAFAVHRPRQVAGFRVILVDDVVTSGSTAQACARRLLEAGALDVALVTACQA